MTTSNEAGRDLLVIQKLTVFALGFMDATGSANQSQSTYTHGDWDFTAQVAATVPQTSCITVTSGPTTNRAEVELAVRSLFYDGISFTLAIATGQQDVRRLVHFERTPNRTKN